MSTRAQVASALASIGVLTLGWQVGTANGQTVAATTTTTTSGTSGTSTTSTASGTSTTSTASGTTSTAAKTTTTTTTTSTSSLKDGTFVGASSSNRYGSVQVTITVAGGKITAVNATSTANDNKSAQYNARAIPTLKSATLSAQSGNISTVSGATYTSVSYQTSLQSALDQAKA